MREVAALAGVSVKTVSNVVNDYPHIRHATRARVEDAIDALGYHVNETARGLRRGRTGAIGLTIPELGVPYFAELANSVVNAANARGLSVLIELTGGDRERELEVITRPRNSLVDGLIFSPLGLGMEDKQRLETDYPIVLLGERIFGGPTDHVTMANVDGARLATEFLLARGARRIALLGAHPGETVGSAGLRAQGYEEALRDAGIPLQPELLLEAGPWHRSTGAEALERALCDGVEFDAVFGLNDALALGALHVLHERRIAVPHEVQVIGFDDIEDDAYSVPTLTSLSPGRDQIAESALDLLLARIAGQSEVEPRLVVVPCEVVERNSTRDAPGRPAS